MEKITYGLKSVYYALATINSNGTATYGTPKAFPGAVSISLAPNGDRVDFYADDVVYWTGENRNGYEGDLEMALITDDFRKDILGDTLDNDGVLIEAVNTQTVHFALLFEFQTDDKARRHVFYNCVASRPEVASETKQDTISPKTEKVSIRAMSIFNSALNKDITKGVAGTNTTTGVYSSWYSSVHQPA